MGHHCKLDSSPKFKDFCDEIDGITKDVNGKKRGRIPEVYQHLEDSCSSVNQRFPNDQYLTLQNRAWAGPFKLPKMPTDFNVVLCRLHW